MPSLTGKTVIVTGANSGIGLEAARMFASKGAHVVFAVRDQTRGGDAAATVTGSTEVRHLDLADLRSVRAFAEKWTQDIHLLVNNAGVMVPPLGRTADGFELQFGINHLGHFALTNLLLPHISGRVVTVASSAHRSATIDFGDLNWHTVARYSLCRPCGGRGPRSCRRRSVALGRSAVKSRRSRSRNVGAVLSWRVNALRRLTFRATSP